MVEIPSLLTKAVVQSKRCIVFASAGTGHFDGLHSLSSGPWVPELNVCAVVHLLLSNLDLFLGLVVFITTSTLSLLHTQERHKEDMINYLHTILNHVWTSE